MLAETCAIGSVERVWLRVDGPLPTGLSDLSDPWRSLPSPQSTSQRRHAKQKPCPRELGVRPRDLSRLPRSQHRFFGGYRKLDATLARASTAGSDTLSPPRGSGGRAVPFSGSRLASSSRRVTACSMVSRPAFYYGLRLGARPSRRDLAYRLVGTDPIGPRLHLDGSARRQRPLMVAIHACCVASHAVSLVPVSR